MRRAAILATLIAALAAVPASPAARSTGCGLPGYSYAGLGGTQIASGVAADIRYVAVPNVSSGHVAAWVGLGGYGAGKNGLAAWLQAGIITKVGGEPSLYYEVTRPGYKPKLVVLGPARKGQSYSFTVREGNRPGWWRVSVDDRLVADPISLPGSHGRWEATATAESWDGGQSVCNRFQFAFGSVSVRRPGAGWGAFGDAFTLASPGYRISRSGSSFRAHG